MIPTIDRRATGVNIRRIMDQRNISVKDLQNHLGLGSIQSIYHWLNGICLPSLDNLYAMSVYFQLPLDSLICGSEPRLRTGFPFPDAGHPYPQIIRLRRHHISRFIYWEQYTLAALSEQLHARCRIYSVS